MDKAIIRPWDARWPGNVRTMAWWLMAGLIGMGTMQVVKAVPRFWIGAANGRSS